MTQGLFGASPSLARRFLGDPPPLSSSNLVSTGFVLAQGISSVLHVIYDSFQTVKCIVISFDSLTPSIPPNCLEALSLISYGENLQNFFLRVRVTLFSPNMLIPCNASSFNDA
jgi:hypothetical protein